MDTEIKKWFEFSDSGATLDEDISDLGECMSHSLIEIVLSDKRMCGDMIDKYYWAINIAIRKIEKAGENYVLAPIWIGDNVDVVVLSALPSLVESYKIRCQVIENKLFILDLVYSKTRAAGVPSLVGQCAIWQSKNGEPDYFLLFGDAIVGTKDGQAAPDLVICAGRDHNPTNEKRKIVIAEVEVSNRSPSQMRRDFSGYFNEITMDSVIGIKAYGCAECPVVRVAVVHWRKGANGQIYVARALDVGFLSLTSQTKKHFSDEAPGLLPPVAVGQWERLPPLPDSILPFTVRYLTYDRLTLLTAWFVSRENRQHMFPLGAPVITIEANALRSHVAPVITIEANALRSHLTPIGDIPIVMNDLCIDIGVVLRAMSESASPAASAAPVEPVKHI